MSKKPSAGKASYGVYIRDEELKDVVDQIMDQLILNEIENIKNPAIKDKKEDTIEDVASGSRATEQVTSRAQSYGLKSLSIPELKSVYALFAWVANEQGAAEETVQSMTETRFGVNDVTKLRQKDYDEVIKFLVDLRIDEMQH